MKPGRLSSAAAIVMALAGSPLAVFAQLSLTRDANEIVVTSSVPPTWKIVIATAPRATPQNPGGGTVRALHIPANHPESLVETDPTRFRLARWGIDSLEWRYIEDGKGVREALGSSATIGSLEIVKQMPQEIVIALTGQWRNIPRFTRRITIDPRGFHTRLEADWGGVTDKRAMWWMLTVPRSDRVDQKAMMISDPDTPAVPLPMAREGVFSLPKGIGFPYEITFPTTGVAVRELRLRMNVFGTDQPVGLRYELWPEEHGVFKFFPRWVDRNFERRTYVFDYAWTFVPEEKR
jgi:hypothetical protein